MCRRLALVGDEFPIRGDSNQMQLLEPVRESSNRDAELVFESIEIRPVIDIHPGTSSFHEILGHE